MKKLPKWETLKANYPAIDAESVFKLIGGMVKLNGDNDIFENACAIRVSRALNVSGGAHVIPFIKSINSDGKAISEVSSGSNKLWHIFRVKTLTKHLTKNYGDPESYTPKDYKLSLKDRRGIIIYEVEGWEDATGHADLWNGEAALWQGYGTTSRKILFWEAPSKAIKEIKQ